MQFSEDVKYNNNAAKTGYAKSKQVLKRPKVFG
jgi:hypothetical protein